jgi:hypothetical protein
MVLLLVLGGCAPERQEFQKHPIAFGGMVAVFAVAIGGALTHGYQ